MKIKFFIHEEKCKEFKILTKATSEFATRVDIRKGQELYKKIYSNIIAIDYKVNEIEESITNRNLEISSIGKELVESGKLKIEYEPNLEQKLHIDHASKFMNYTHFINESMNRILEFLDFSFDYETYKKQASKIMETRENNWHSAESVNNELIEESIETVLKHYSDISFKYIKYLNIFLENE
jgi:hypothetical protein